MRFASLIIKCRPILDRIPEYHHFKEQLWIGRHNSRQNRWPQWPGSTRSSGKRSVFLGGNGLLFELSFPPDWPFFDLGILDDSVQCWSNSRVEDLKIWSMGSSNGTRRLKIIHCFNHLHFFDPQHSFRRKLWTSTYFSLSFHKNPDLLIFWAATRIFSDVWN